MPLMKMKLINQSIEKLNRVVPRSLCRLSDAKCHAKAENQEQTATKASNP
jgi:hypothetical protein